MLKTKTCKPAPVEDDYPHQFDSPESSNVAGATYDAESESLTITFRGGKRYAYATFPVNLWREFVGAASKGKFFAERIRPFFAGKPL